MINKDIENIRYNRDYDNNITNNNNYDLKSFSTNTKNNTIEKTSVILWQKLDNFVQTLNYENENIIKIKAIKIGIVSTLMGSISIGYVAWLFREGTLLVAMLTHIPAWQAFDPLPILENRHKNDKIPDENPDTRKNKEDELERKIQSFFG